MQTTRTNNVKEKHDPEHAEGALIGPHDDGKNRRKDKQASTQTNQYLFITARRQQGLR